MVSKIDALLRENFSSNPYKSPQATCYTLYVHCWQVNLMKVVFSNSITSKVLERINALSSNVVLRSDLADLADPRQISRALRRLVKTDRLVKLGYGVYGKLSRSEIAKASYLKGGVLPTLREALTRLKVRWEPSSEEQAYQSGLSTQVPANPSTKLKDRFRRKLCYRAMELKLE